MPSFRVDYEENIPHLLRQFKHDMTLAQLQSIQVPTLVLAGESDSIKREHTEAMANAIPNAKLMIIEGASHFLVFEKPEAVNAAILEFLQQK